jgi:hypothetical protein
MSSIVCAALVSDVLDFKQRTMNGFQIILATDGIFQRVRRKLFTRATSGC